MKNIFIIGCKGIPSNYGGYETFVENLTFYEKSNDNIKYHVACIGNYEREYEHNGARCFNVKIPNIGPAKAIVYDLRAIKKSIEYIIENKIEDAIIYILACRIGPFLHHYKKIMKKYGILLYVNPDGHEWLRAKWSKPVKKYWKFSERLMIKESDLVICDSKNIEKYILKSYSKYNPKTVFIAYGADLEKSKLSNDSKELNEWYNEKNVKSGNYYLVVGRFVPENNYKTMISEFMKSNTKKDLVLITNVEKNKFYEQLRLETGFEKDSRIKFVGTVYEKELIKKIRENAYAYLHGHAVGGTNPSLIEALATTDLNLLYDVGFNKEVAENGALYWSLDNMNLANLINECDKLKDNKIKELGEIAKNRVIQEYTWSKIVGDYKKLFLG
ncbi:MAG: glycosyltransferase family 1 protein [Clostridia bacterium]|nr:glycosyltransferase family 1 protein [Clostridia bacterium]